MAKRRAWNALSADYRARLQRNGITPAQYEAGESLKAARGHSKTPEHPQDAVKNPGRFSEYREKHKDRYKEYRARVKSLQQLAFEKKERLWGNRHTWHEGRARKYIYTGHGDVKVPGVRKLREFLAMTDDEAEAAISSAGYGIDDDWAFLFYK